MRIKIKKWGNSLALRIPKAFAFQSGIHEDEYVKLAIKDDKIIIEPDRERKYSLKELVSGIKKLNIHDEIKSGKRVGNEVW